VYILYVISYLVLLLKERENAWRKINYSPLATLLGEVLDKNSPGEKIMA
jgi:hypothetical protein